MIKNNKVHINQFHSEKIQKIILNLFQKIKSFLLKKINNFSFTIIKVMKIYYNQTIRLRSFQFLIIFRHHLNFLIKNC